MATDQTSKVLNLASRIVDASDRLMAAVYDLQALEKERAAAGLTLTNYDDDYAASGQLQHVDGAALNSAVNTSAPALLTWLEANGHHTNFNKVRP